MEYIQNIGSVPPQPAGGKSAKNIAVVTVLLVVVLAVAGYAYWKIAGDSQMNIQQETVVQPQTPPTSNVSPAENPASDTTTVIDAELNAAGEVDAIDEHFKDVDAAQKGL